MDPGKTKEKEKKGEEEEGGVEDGEEEEEITASTLRGKPRSLPISAVPTFSYIPPRRQEPKELSYFSRKSQTGVISLYDCVFKRRLDYNQKLHRDDREHAKNLGLHINEEGGIIWNQLQREVAGRGGSSVTVTSRGQEQERPVPVLMSSVYGKRINQPIEPLNRDYGRVNHVQTDFYRKNDIPSIKEPGFGHITPA
ncbi:hypothetical protein ACRRTK_019904 [Alexandromys fortis]